VGAPTQEWNFGGGILLQNRVRARGILLVRGRVLHGARGGCLLVRGRSLTVRGGCLLVRGRSLLVRGGCWLVRGRSLMVRGGCSMVREGMLAGATRDPSRCAVMSSCRPDTRRRGSSGISAAVGSDQRPTTNDQRPKTKDSLVMLPWTPHSTPLEWIEHEARARALGCRLVDRDWPLRQRSSAHSQVLQKREGPGGVPGPCTNTRLDRTDEDHDRTIIKRARTSRRA